MIILFCYPYSNSGHLNNVFCISYNVIHFAIFEMRGESKWVHKLRYLETYQDK